MPDESSSANTASGGNQTPGPLEKLLFNCDHLIMFCSNFENLNVHDRTDSLLDFRLEDLEDRWKKMQGSYECLMLSPEQTNSRDFKENARVNINACSDAYYVARSNILDILRISTPSRFANSRLSLPPPAQPQMHPTVQNVQTDNSVYIKVPPCDTEIFMGGYEQWPSFRDILTTQNSLKLKNYIT